MAEPFAAPPPCIGSDPTCPCQDGDECHYRADDDTPAWGFGVEP